MSQSAKTRRRGPNSLTVRVLLAFGFLLAVGATVVVVFSEDVRWLRLAVLLGLWAALIAAYAVARSRRDARNAEQREGEVSRVYELELQREVSARREFEMKLAESSQDEAQSRRDDELAALREQLDRLTNMLSGLVDGDLLIERLTLSAESTRIRSISDPALGRLTAVTRQQLVEAAGGVTVEHLEGPAWGPQPAPVLGPARPLPASAAPSAAYARRPRVAGPLGFEGSSDQTEQIPRITDDGPLAFPTGPQPVIDALPATPRVVGQPLSDLPVESTGPERDGDIVDAELVEGPAEPDAAPEADDAVVVESLVVESLVVETVVVGSDPIESAVVESDPIESAVVESAAVDSAAVESGPIGAVPGDVEPEADAVPVVDAEVVAAETGPESEAAGSEAIDERDPTPAVVDNSYLSLISESTAGYRRRAAGRSDAPSTAWTIDHRRSTPAAPASDVPSRSRRETRAAAAAAAAEAATATLPVEPPAVDTRTAVDTGTAADKGTAAEPSLATAEDTVPEDTAAQDTAPDDTTAQDAAPDDTTAQDTAAGGSRTAPGTAAPDTVAPTPDTDIDTGHSSGVSVAELVAAYGTGRPPRRRRYADDSD